MKPLFPLLLLAAIGLSSCHKSQKQRNAERDDSLRTALNQYIKYQLPQAEKIDSIILLKVDTLTPKLNISLQYQDWRTYTRRRMQLDSVNREAVTTELYKVKSYFMVSPVLGNTEMAKAKKHYATFTTRFKQTDSCIKNTHLLKAAAQKVKDSVTNMGYALAYRIVYTDRGNVQNKLQGNIRMARNYSVMKTDTLKDLNSTYLIN